MKDSGCPKAYDAGPPQLAYVAFVGVGNALPEMPLFLQRKVYVPGAAGIDLPNYLECLSAPHEKAVGRIVSTKTVGSTGEIVYDGAVRSTPRKLAVT
jgi:hypothetical protein